MISKEAAVTLMSQEGVVWTLLSLSALRLSRRVVCSCPGPLWFLSALV